MSAPALVRQADLRRMAAVAKETGVPMEIEVNGKIYRAVPDVHKNRNKVDIDDDEEIRP